jgi:methionyl aminopeptidase
MLVPGMSTVTLEQEANRLLGLQRSSAPFKQFEGFNHAICVSINDEVVNGPPSRERIIAEGDVVKIAIGTQLRGIHGKVARTRYIGTPIPEDIQRLLEGTQAILDRAPAFTQSCKTLNELLALPQQVANEFDLTLIEKSGGAGIGKSLHDWPATPNHPGDLKEIVELVPGLAFTLMPMLSLGNDAPTWTHEDQWTMMTGDCAMAAHMADTFLMTEDGLVNLSSSSLP